MWRFRKILWPSQNIWTLPLWSGYRGKAKLTKVQTKQKVTRISLSRLALHMIWAWPMELLLISLFLQKFSLIVKWLVIWIITIWWNISKCCLVMRCFSKKLGKVVFLEFLDEIQSFPFNGKHHMCFVILTLSCYLLISIL